MERAVDGCGIGQDYLGVWRRYKFMQWNCTVALFFPYIWESTLSSGSAAIAFDEEYVSTYFSHPQRVVLRIWQRTISQSIGHSNAVYFVYVHNMFSFQASVLYRFR